MNGIGTGVDYFNALKGVSIVDTITQLKGYKGSNKIVYVQDTVQGGIFNYVTGLVKDDGVVFDAVGMGSGFWQRDLTPSPTIDVQWFGAKCDGVTDDREALLKAISYCLNNGGTLFLKLGKILYFTGEIDAFQVRSIKFEGTLTGELTSKFIVGHRSAVTTPCEISFNLVNNATIQLQGAKNIDLKINRAKKLLIYADGDNSFIASCAYNRINIGYVDDLELFSEPLASSIGWINENIFWVGRLTTLIIDGNYPHNHNVFHKPSFENSTIHIKKGFSNIFYDCRFEGTNSITFDEGTFDNQLFKSYSGLKGAVLRETNTPAFTDNGTNNSVNNQLDLTLEERIIHEINSKSKNFNLQGVTINSEDISIPASFVFLETGLVPCGIDPFGFSFVSNISLFRMTVTLYDSSKNQIIEEPTNDIISSTFLQWNLVSNNYITSSNRSTANVGILKSDNVRYIKIRIASANSGSIIFAKASIKHNKNYNQTIPIITETKKMSLNAIPTIGTFEEGDIVYNKDLASGVFAWICTASGTPGSWKAIT
ncbi:hypothetical protein [Flavobacterium alkalisoli]|uniref:hypothetical protein n=1 Tax=Flavobacterium alkalisoli TaxID=2602769 RepID=UPI003A94D357